MSEETVELTPPVENKKHKKKDKFVTPLAPHKTFKQGYLDFISEKKYLLLCFAVPMLIMLAMYMVYEIYPIGNGSVLVLDLNGQYVYFFEGLRDIIYGDGSLLYSFSRALGGEFIGIFAYYLSSPFSFIVALFPKEAITEALLVMFLLKTGACGLTFGIFIETTRKQRNRVATVMFSTMYALCSYCVVMQHNTMWIDNVILLPIIMIGIDNLISYGKYRLFVISLTFAVISNFYIGYMTCIFCAVYFFYSYFSRSVDEVNPLGEKLHFLKSLGRMILFSVISIGICAALLGGTYYSLTFGKTTFSHPDYSASQRMDWLDMISKLFIGSYDTVRPEGMPFLYSGTLALILCPLYFFAPHIKTREKIATGLMVVFFLVSFNVSTIDIFWHGMQKPNWLNYRYSYMLCFFLILMSYKAYEKLKEIGYQKAIVSSIVWALILFVIQKMDYENVQDFATVWLSLGIIVFYLCVLRACTWNDTDTRRAGTLILAILVGAEMFGSGLLNIQALDEDVAYSSRSGYRTFIDGLRPVVNNVKINDESFYRMEKTYHRKTNDNFALGMNGLSNSTSTLNKDTISLLHDFGIASKSHWSEYLGGTPILDTIFGIKYVITKSDDEEIMELYTETDYGNDDYTVWQNPYATSIAYGVSTKVKDLELHDEYDSAFERMNALVTAMIGKEHGVKMFRSADYMLTDTGDLSSTVVANHTKYYSNSESGYNRITFTIDVTSTDVIYCHIPSKYLNEAYLYVDGLKSGSIFGNDTDRIIEIGQYRPGDKVEVSIEVKNEYFYIFNNANYFYYLNSSDVEKYLQELNSSPFVINKYSDDKFEGTINVSEGDELIFTSIPYDEAWAVYLDGEKVETFELINGLIGFEATSGEHTLVMKYMPKLVSYGIVIQFASLAIFVVAWVVDKIKRKKYILSGRTVYDGPMAGEELILPEESAFFEEENNSDEYAEENDFISDNEESSVIDRIEEIVNQEINSKATSQREEPEDKQ